MSGIFFHDLGRIHASLFCLPRCSKLTYLGARSFNSQFNLSTDCVTFSPSLACRSTCVLDLTSIKVTVLDGEISRNSLVFFTVPLFIDTTLFHAYPASVWAPFYFQSGRPRSRPFVTQLHRDPARHAGLPYISFKGHSFLLRHSVYCGSCRLTRLLYKRVWDRWLLVCYQMYIHTPEAVVLSAVPQMASVSGDFI